MDDDCVGKEKGKRMDRRWREEATVWATASWC